MKPDQINLFAVIAAALSTFVLGGLWYSPALFGRLWMRSNNFTEADLQRVSKVRSFGGSALLALIMATNLAFFLGDEKTTVVWGMVAGALAGAGWVAAAVGIIGLFENRSWTYIGINAGYQIVAFIIMGAILGSWR
ncbi:MAG TPA: DUF1761 domain-containing protein [Verrucomicrobiota bacterium]|nr:DUF1761 domain-containing protein [Verrucomicrobiales bacterium]HRI13279.1 DUF1761 domain-containing protein [Verrucomicrobiota bacterium]